MTSYHCGDHETQHNKLAKEEGLNSKKKKKNSLWEDTSVVFEQKEAEASKANMGQV